MLNGIRKHLRFTLAVGASVLLGADDDGFGAITLVDAIDHFVKSFHLSNLLGRDIEEVLLDGTLGTDTHHDDTSPLILHPLNEDPIQHLGGCLDDGDGRTGGGDESRFVVLPVLQEVFAEGIAANKDTHNRGDGTLTTQLFGTSTGIVGDVGTERFLVGIIPLKERLVQMDFFFDNCSLGTTSSPLSSCQVRTMLILLKV